MLNILKKHKKKKILTEQLINLNNCISMQIFQFENTKAYTKYNAGYRQGVIDAFNNTKLEIENILEEV